MILKEFNRRTERLYPFGYGLAWKQDHARIHILAPWGLHLILRLAYRMHCVVEYTITDWLQRKLPGGVQHCPTNWNLPWMTYILRDEVAEKRGYGFCWEQSEHCPGYHSYGRYIAPLGLNIIYAIVRWAYLRMRAPHQ